MLTFLDAVTPLERIRISGQIAAKSALLKTELTAIARIRLSREVMDLLALLDISMPDGDEPADELSDDPNSPNYRYRDTGYIADSRKEKAASQIRLAKESGTQVQATAIDWKAIEKNPREAAELIVKSNLFGQVDWDAMQSAGVDTAAAFLIDRVYASIAPAPQDEPQARQDYALALTTIRSRLEALSTVKEVRAALAEIYDEMTGANLAEDETADYLALREKVEGLKQQKSVLDKSSNDLYQTMQLANVQVYDAERKLRNREKRNWPIEDAHRAEVDDAKAYRDKVNTEWVALRGEINPKIDHIENAISAVYSLMSAIKQQARERSKASPLVRGWFSLGDKFMAVIKYRYRGGSTAFLNHVTNAEAGKINDWSWATKEKAKPVRKATEKEVTFQLKVIDKFERIGGRSVSAESTAALKDVFGLREVQSGNWVLKDPNSAKFHVEQTAAAFSDLSDMLGIDMQHLGLGGRLGMAFGARGTGGKNAARAHYESVHRVVNLTKMGGGGALGHELFHAFDNILPSLINGTAGAKTQFGTSTPDIIQSPAIRDAFASLRTALMTGDIRQQEAFSITDKDRAMARRNVNNGYAGSVSRAISNAADATEAILAVDRYFAGSTTKKTVNNWKQWRRIAVAHHAPQDALTISLPTGPKVSSFLNEATALDSGENGKYWSQDVELAARAFQSWIEDKMDGEDRRNDYLSAMADNRHYDDAKPFPEGEERTRINAAFEALFKVIRDEQVFEKATANKPLLDSIFGGGETLNVDEALSASGALFDSLERMDTLQTVELNYKIGEVTIIRITNPGTRESIEMPVMVVGANVGGLYAGPPSFNIVFYSTWGHEDGPISGLLEMKELMLWRYGAGREPTDKEVGMFTEAAKTEGGSLYFKRNGSIQSVNVSGDELAIDSVYGGDARTEFDQLIAGLSADAADRKEKAQRLIDLIPQVVFDSLEEEEAAVAAAAAVLSDQG